MLYRWVSKFVLLILFVTLVQSVEIFAAMCQCAAVSVCQAYSRADEVFIGKATGVRIEQSSFIPEIVVDFKVEKRFKGDSETVERVRFKRGECFQLNFVVGEQYFVYKNRTLDRSLICNRTSTVALSKTEIQHAESLSQSDPQYTIAGMISGVPKEDFKRIKLVVENENKSTAVRLNNDGFFSFSTKSSSSLFTVKLLLPYEATIFMRDLEVIYSSSGSVIEYKAELRPNECNFREISLSEIRPKT